jgi:crotonobetainyl-CoA:carnitine CoA-transferase CaiB-like acyl-CoA transferase
MVGNPSKMNGTPISYRSAPPLLGEQNEEILKSAGFDADQIKTLVESGVI